MQVSGCKAEGFEVSFVERKAACGPEQLEKTMNKKLKSSALMLGVVLLMSAPAFARTHGGQPSPAPGTSSGAAPEVDPSLALAGLTFLSGSLVVLRSRRRK
jgi:LPXTG-motif cell wall-anchored protein